MHVAGASHVSFSVADLERSVAWYEAVFEAEVMMREPPRDGRSAAVLTLPKTTLMVGLVEFARGAGETFDPTRTGLDHFAYAVDSKGALDRWVEHLDRHDIEHSGAIDVPPGAILNFKDPDGIALALFWRRG
ncbi:MAG TPA: VOC family protein [Acidimicrobiales bacterium]|nr:VOC family protein [Acidimicrobiales bacterium]